MNDATSGRELALRRRMTEVLRATWTRDAALALVLTGWYYRYGLGRFRDHLYDTFDQKLMIYLLEWLRHSLLAGDVAHVFHPNVLYPNPNVLAWSDTLLGFLPIYGLLRSVTSNPILALNCTSFIAVFAGTLGMMRLGRGITGRTSFVAGAVGGVGLLAAAMEGHFQFKSLCLLVWALYFAAQFARGSARALPWFIALSAWLFLCSVYYAVMLAVFVVSSLLLALVVGRLRFVRWLKGTLAGIRPAPACLIVVGSLVPVLWVARHYLQVKNQFGGFPLDEMVTYSARLASLLDAPQTNT